MRIVLLLALALLVAAPVCSAQEMEPLKVFIGEYPGLWSFINFTVPAGNPLQSVPLSDIIQPNVLLTQVVNQGFQGCQSTKCYWFDLTYLFPNGIGSRVRMTRSRGNAIGVPLFITQEKGIEWRPLD